MRANGYLVFDGCWVERALRWSYTQLPDHQALPVLLGTDYHALKELGPIVIPVSRGDAADSLWQANNSLIKHGVWLETALSPNAILDFMQARLQVADPSGRSYWLRLTDSRPLLRVFQADMRWPEDFWDGIDAVWSNTEDGPVQVWGSLFQVSTHSLITKKKRQQMTPPFIFGQALLDKLAGTDKESVA